VGQRSDVGALGAGGGDGEADGAHAQLLELSRIIAELPGRIHVDAATVFGRGGNGCGKQFSDSQGRDAGGIRVHKPEPCARLRADPM
jgi:hypothetical protein